MPNHANKLSFLSALTLTVCLLTWIFTRIHFVQRNNIEIRYFFIRLDYTSIQFHNCWIYEKTIAITIIMHDGTWIVFGQKAGSRVEKSLVYLQELSFNTLRNNIPIDFDMVFAIRSLMLMIKSKGVEDLK